MAVVRHLGFVGRLLRPPTMTTWWSLWLRQIWLKSMQYSFYNMKLSIFCQFGWKKLIHAPKSGVLGVFHPQNGEQYLRNPQKAHLSVVTVLEIY